MTDGPLLWIQVVLAVAVLALLLFLIFTWARRRTLSRGASLVVCGIRKPGESRWRAGLLRYDMSRLDVFRLGGFSMRPSRRWQRGLLHLGPPSSLAPQDGPVMLPSAVGLPCRYRDETFELTMTREDYTALRSWLESCPPGHNVNVA